MNKVQATVSEYTMIIKEQPVKYIPVKLIFTPVCLEVPFQNNLRYQVAIFRSSTDEKGKKILKMDKTEPVKLSSPQEKIYFNKILNLLTTIPFDPESQRFQNKQVDLQIALQFDGNKCRLGDKINLKEVIEGKGKSSKFVYKKPEVSLSYKAEVKFQEQQVPENANNLFAKKKIIRFDENIKQEREELKEKNNEPGPKTDRGSRHKTIAGNIRAENTLASKEEAKMKDQKLIKCKSLNNNEEPSDHNEIPKDNASIQAILVNKQSEDKYKQLNALNATLQAEKKELQKKLKQKDAKISQLIEQIEQLQKKVEIDTKSDRSAKELLKREQSAKNNLEKQVGQLKEEIKNYKKEIEKLSKTVISYQESSKNIASGSEAEIKSLKDKIKLLQKTEFQSTNQVEKYYGKLKDKEESINELKSKVLGLQKQNLELRQNIKQVQKKLERQKEQYELEMEQLRDNVKEVKDENKTLKLPSSRDLKEDPTQLRKKIETLQKQLERKEQLLKKMTEIKKNSEQDIASENSSLKKQVSQLKDMIDKLQNKRSQQLSSTTSIEYRVQMQKMKKQLQLCKKNEKSLLIEKGKVQASNKQFQEEIIKGKQTIVNILNLVQETGNDKLITEAYSLME